MNYMCFSVNVVLVWCLVLLPRICLHCESILKEHIQFDMQKYDLDCPDEMIMVMMVHYYICVDFVVRNLKTRRIDYDKSTRV